MDVASFRGLVDAPKMQSAKEVLRQIARMEVRLRRSWEKCVMERPEAYGTDSERYFLHESLEVYQRSLQVHEAMDALWQSGQTRTRHVKRIDELTTSLTRRDESPLSASACRLCEEKQEKSWFRQDEAVKVKVSGAG